MNVIIFDRLRGHARELNLAHPKAIAVIALGAIVLLGGAFLPVSTLVFGMP